MFIVINMKVNRGPIELREYPALWTNVPSLVVWMSFLKGMNRSNSETLIQEIILCQ